MSLRCWLGRHTFKRIGIFRSGRELVKCAYCKKILTRDTLSHPAHAISDWSIQ